MELIAIAERLRLALEGLTFGAPVTHVYNPLRYAWDPHARYLRRFGAGKGRVLLLGMNPGPWGMVQTGVPFGDVAMVRGWLGIEGRVERPAVEHPRRPVAGFACRRREASGRRLWGWARQRYGEPEHFFSRFFVTNYCPLCFFESDGRNRTPDRLPPAQRLPLFERCDAALRETLAALEPVAAIGLGALATARLVRLFADTSLRLGRVPHPSPANPRAAAWGEQMDEVLRVLGLENSTRLEKKPDLEG